MKFVRFICVALMLAFPAAAAVKKTAKKVRPKAPPASAKARAQAQDYANNRMDDTARSLLPLFELQKALYELRYELDNRPDWVGIPLAGILGFIDGERNGATTRTEISHGTN